MTKKALVVNNVAAVVEADAATVNANYHPSVAAQFQDVPDAVVKGSTLSGSTWSPPPAPAAVNPSYATVSAAGFYNLFKPAERIAIKASADAVVKEFYATLQVQLAAGEPVNLNLPAVQEGLTYLSTTNVAGTSSPYIAPSRVAEILGAIPQ